MNRFESTCQVCRTRITTANGGGTWRHSSAPADRHQAGPSGAMIQI